MELNNSVLDKQDMSDTGGYALQMSNNEILGIISLPKSNMNQDPSFSSNNTGTVDSSSRNVHIPYILNGELFEIQTQEGENVTVKCCNCPPDRVYRGSVRSTGNFHMHIKRRHPDLMGKIYDMKVNALVERRDRFLRNRKSTRRRSSNALGNKGCSSRNGQRLACSAQPPSELFKIKAAFQRHQLQQQQNQDQQKDSNRKQVKTEQSSRILHKWNMIDHFLSTPAIERVHNNALMDTYNEQPLNYSFKQYTNEDDVFNINYIERVKERKTTVNSYANEIQPTEVANEQITEFELLKSLKNKSVTQEINCISSKQRSLSDSSLVALTQHDKCVPLHPSNSDQSLFGRATTLSAITPCPSDVSGYDDSQGSNGRSFEFNCSRLGIIKNELIYTEMQPIDLSVHPSSSELLGSSGFGSTLDAKQTSSNNTSTFSVSAGNLKCSEVLLQVADALQNLHRELQSHNQTNNHWLCLEKAKFKFLHPEFQFLY